MKQLPSVQLVGGADSDPEQRASWERDTGFDSFASFEELVEEGRPEVIVVATPPHSHADLCVAGLEAGLHVLCEKPFVADVMEANRVLASAAAAGTGRCQSRVPRDADLPRAQGADRRGGHRPARLLPDLAADGSRPVGRAGSVARGDAEPGPSSRAGCTLSIC